ncbi:MAG: Bax inhibitor-1/YccA family protein [Treponemataceae bacterium]|nr:Bax inhibitor-1/YccA family protein [Treponemataceae bacterium]
MADPTVSSGEFSEVRAKNTFLARVYGWMTLALVISAASAAFTAGNPALLKLIFGSRFGFLILAAAEIALVWWLSASIRKISTAGASAAFVIYSVLNGMTLSSIFFVYAGASIFKIFAISAAMFAAMAAYGTATKSNIRSAGRYLSMALIGLIIASLVNLLLRSPALDWILSIVTVVLFTGLTAYDANKMLAVSEHASDNDVFKKASIIGALELYLDFINIFLAMLRLFGRARD